MVNKKVQNREKNDPQFTRIKNGMEKLFAL